ncbi:GNAT family N-acetyltransferase [Nocardia sp. BSTN01]|uniref:GNAT family N-acetyltransferase n=1 Tax=Nocardia sp. BSTN01 TaxID=2783665 RepID=UPI002815A045|nr:GNAT family N-acetyltransferase [Nocardia sp. BSTN01]
MSRILTNDPASLTTTRLVLRSWTSAEAAAVRDDHRQADWAEDFPSEGDRVIASLFAEHPAWLEPYGQRLIIERATGLVVGGIGLFWPPDDGQLEIGYGVVATRRGRGYAAEATRALTEFALTAPEVHTVFANVESANPASVRVLEKAGFGLVGESRGPEGEHLACYRTVADRR